MTDIRECPFCHSPGQMQIGPVWSRMRVDHMFRVGCSSAMCEAAGPMQLTPHDAIRSWNRGTAPTDEVSFR